MPKHDFLTPKAISNRIKAIGLQKLRWYCQMCQKQCRDENGFKCHTTSEGHLRQMRLFAENPNSIIDTYSQDFEKGYLETLSHRHGTKRVLANRVYQEYIADKHHIHMNSTVWTSLTGFCKYLGKEGKAIVDETEKGWFIQFIDRDPKVLAKQMQSEQRQKAELDDEERSRRMIQAQIAAANARVEGGGGEEGDIDDNRHDHQEGSEEEAVLGSKRDLTMKLSEPHGKKRKVLFFGDSVFESASSNKSGADSANRSTAASKSGQTVAGMSQIDKFIIDEERRKAAQIASDDKRDRKENWLHPGIVVKITNKKLADGKYYKQKGVVRRVMPDNEFVGEIQVIDSKAILRLDQEHLETVIPKVGSKVLIVNGRGRGMVAIVMRINEADFNCDVRVSTEENNTGDSFYVGRELNAIEYEDISRIAVDE